MSVDQKAIVWLTNDEIAVIQREKPIKDDMCTQWEIRFSDGIRVVLKLIHNEDEHYVQFEWYDKLGKLFYEDSTQDDDVIGEFWPDGTKYADHYLYVLEEGDDPADWGVEDIVVKISSADRDYLRSYGFCPTNTECTAWKRMIGKCQVTITWDDKPKWWLAETFQPDVFPAFYASANIHDALYGLLYRFRQNVIKNIYERQSSLKAVESLLIDLGNDTIDKSCMEKKNVPEESDKC